MTATSLERPEFKAEYVNPVIIATRSVFETMLGCQLKRTGLAMKDTTTSTYEISGVIGVSGKVAGTIVLSLSQQAAFEILDRLVGIKATVIDDDVCDAVGEITNMIAGQAKAQLEHYALTISIPTIITGRNHAIHYPSQVKPICVFFDSDIGPFVIEFGFVSKNQTLIPQHNDEGLGRG